LTEQDETTFRIISARWATRNEQTLYHAYMEQQHD
jgi:uncharacterized DUF497 family protein